MIFATRFIWHISCVHNKKISALENKHNARQCWLDNKMLLLRKFKQNTGILSVLDQDNQQIQI